MTYLKYNKSKFCFENYHTISFAIHLQFFNRANKLTNQRFLAQLTI